MGVVLVCCGCVLVFVVVGRIRGCLVGCWWLGLLFGCGLVFSVWC